MIKLIIKLEGTIKEFTKTESGNTAFYMIDKYGNTHYCFLTNSYRIGNPSDEIIIIGVSSKYKDKIRVEFAENITNYQRYEKKRKSSSIYWLSIFLILISIAILAYSIYYLITGDFGDLTDEENVEGITNLAFGIVCLVLALTLIITLIPLLYVQKKTLNFQNDVDKFIRTDGKGFSADEFIPYKNISSNIKAKEININDFIPSENLTTTSNAKYCSNCGEKLPQNIKFCPECGSRL
ncbi:MAG: zinc ribbon domain-containing protein [Candidatus Lokiarchaeota archaeon]|nr:zinc ribbon domain-containing protein [Candidatus Lokiarchaeota archaeon]